jgi:hypothetical protein
MLSLRRMRFLWLTLVLIELGACALMRRPSQDPRCLDLESECRTDAECCSDFCANGECVDNRYQGGSKLVPRRNERTPHAE